MTPEVHAAATTLADKFNAKHKEVVLRVAPLPFTPITLDQVAELRTLGRWVSANGVFEHLHKRRAARGELINLGAQLRKVFVRHKSSGATAFYFLGPVGATPPAL